MSVAYIEFADSVLGEQFAVVKEGERKVWLSADLPRGMECFLCASWDGTPGLQIQDRVYFSIDSWLEVDNG